MRSTAGIVEVKCLERRQPEFVELQSWGRHVWNFTHERIRLEHDAHLDWIFGAIGSKLTKNFSELDLAGEGRQRHGCPVSTSPMATSTWIMTPSRITWHRTPPATCSSRAPCKGHSRSVWQGMIYVAKGAAKTDGYQANRNLVLEEGARADSIPGLEILADDVRCTHGATVGKLEAEPLFYLRSRGIPEAEAARILVEGFFDPIMQRIPFEGVRSRFQQAILEKMGTAPREMQRQEHHVRMKKTKKAADEERPGKGKCPPARRSARSAQSQCASTQEARPSLGAAIAPPRAATPSPKRSDEARSTPARTLSRQDGCERDVSPRRQGRGSGSRSTRTALPRRPRATDSSKRRRPRRQASPPKYGPAGSPARRGLAPGQSTAGSGCPDAAIQLHAGAWADSGFDVGDAWRSSATTIWMANASAAGSRASWSRWTTSWSPCSSDRMCF